MKEEVYVLEFDGKSKNFNIHSLEDMVKKNERAFRDKIYLTYIPLFIGSDVECHEKMRELAILV